MFVSLYYSTLLYAQVRTLCLVTVFAVRTSHRCYSSRGPRSWRLFGFINLIWILNIGLFFSLFFVDSKSRNQNPESQPRFVFRVVCPLEPHYVILCSHCVRTPKHSTPSGNLKFWMTFGVLVYMKKAKLLQVSFPDGVWYLVFLFIIFTFQLTSQEVLPSAIFWTSRGHRCRPFPPARAFNFYRA